MLRKIVSVIASVIAITLHAQTESFNNEWKYQRGDYPKASKVSFDDTNWQSIGLPHSFSIPYFMEKDFYVGYGWYRKVFECTSKSLKDGRKTYIDFDGVFQEAEVFINGKPAGSHRGGYTGFRIDATPYVHAGNNLIAVRVNNLWQATLAPRAGEHVFSGGIYRSVRIVRKSATHIDWCGLCITTPGLKESDGKLASVNVDVTVKNADKTSDLHTEISIFDETGKQVIKGSSNARQSELSINAPHLWSPSSPYLYTLVCRLYDGKTLLDEESEQFGFRWFDWTADHGFFINGEHLFFHGANVHQDQAGWGDAVTEEAARRDVRMVKEAGFDMIRGSHYPRSPAFVDECDKQGILFWSEAPFWATYGKYHDGGWQANPYPLDMKDSEAFEANVLSQLKEMILIHRNSPSVFVWSMCNEVFFSLPEYQPQIRNLLIKMTALAHQLDPTRKVAIGGSQRPIGEGRLDKLADIAGYNGDGANIADFQNPGIPSVVTEYGSTTADRPGKYIPGWGDLTRNDSWKGVEWRSGQAIWCAFDHGSIFGQSMGKMGIIDYFRIPKRSWYWYRNEYRHITPPEWPQEGQPTQLKISTSKSGPIKADGTDDIWIQVSVLDKDGRELSNNPDVDLTIVSGPGEFPTGRTIHFSSKSDIRILDGKAAIAMRSYYNGTAIVQATSEGLSPATLKVKFTGGGKWNKNLIHALERLANHSDLSSGLGEHTISLFGINAPTFVSTSAEGHSACMATDGKVETFWKAADNDNTPYITLDVERTIALSSGRITFTEGGVHPVLIEVSTDNESWALLSDYRMTPFNGRELNFTSQYKPQARFVRISFLSAKDASVADFTVNGTIK